MARTMIAAVVRKVGKPLAVEEVPVPRPSASQTLLCIAADGIGHTEFPADKGDQ